MSYHGRHNGLGAGFYGPSPGFTPTTAFAQAVDPYSLRYSPPGAIYAPYGWGPDMMIGMPANYTHHLDYVREPVGPPDMVPIQTAHGYGYVKATPRTMAMRRAQERGRRLGTRPVGPMYDVLSGSWSGGGPGYVTEGSSGQLAGILAVL